MQFRYLWKLIYMSTIKNYDWFKKGLFVRTVFYSYQCFTVVLNKTFKVNIKTLYHTYYVYISGQVRLQKTYVWIYYIHICMQTRRSIFRTQSSIYDWTFLRKQKSSIVDVQLGDKYSSEHVLCCKAYMKTLAMA